MWWVPSFQPHITFRPSILSPRRVFVELSRALRIRHLNVAPVSHSCSFCVGWGRGCVETSLAKLILLMTSPKDNLKVAPANVWKTVPQHSKEPLVEHFCWVGIVVCLVQPLLSRILSMVPYSQVLIDLTDEQAFFFFNDFVSLDSNVTKWETREFVTLLSYRTNNRCLTHQQVGTNPWWTSFKIEDKLHFFSSSEGQTFAPWWCSFSLVMETFAQDLNWQAHLHSWKTILIVEVLSHWPLGSPNFLCHCHRIFQLLFEADGLHGQIY